MSDRAVGRPAARAATQGATEPEPKEAAVPHWGWPLSAAAAGMFVAGAVVLEWLSGQRANSPVPGWAEFAPLGWPQQLRVAWWLFVALAAGWFRYGMHRYGMRQRALVVLATVGPFVAFAFGVATGAEWSTWH